jgi:hypothetical protein
MTGDGHGKGAVYRQRGDNQHKSHYGGDKVRTHPETGHSGLAALLFRNVPIPDLGR